MPTGPNPIREFLQAEWSAISAAPFSFVAAVLALGVIIWLALRWRYGGLIEHRDGIIAKHLSTIALLERQREKMAEPEPAALPAPRASADRSTNYNPKWKKVDAYALWQAAWLWVGEEPRAEVRDGTPAYPILRMLKAAGQSGDLAITTERELDRKDREHLRSWGLAIQLAAGTPGPPVTMISVVRRDELMRFAATKGEHPDILQD